MINKIKSIINFIKTKFVLAGEFIEYLKYKIKDAVMNFKTDPINYSSFLNLLLIKAISILAGIVAYVFFIATGGYSTQAELSKKYGLFSGYGEKFTLGTVNVLFSRFVVVIVLILCLIELVLMMFIYYDEVSKLKKVLMSILLPVFIIEVPVWLVTNFLGFGYGFILCLTIATIITFISLLTLLLTTESCRETLKNTMVSALIYFIVTPLVLLFLENIIPLFAGLVSVIIIGAILLFLLGKEHNPAKDEEFNEYRRNYDGYIDHMAEWAKEGLKYDKDCERAERQRETHILEYKASRFYQKYKDTYISDNILEKIFSCKIDNKHRLTGTKSYSDIHSQNVEVMKDLLPSFSKSKYFSSNDRFLKLITSSYIDPDGYAYKMVGEIKCTADGLLSIKRIYNQYGLSEQIVSDYDRYRKIPVIYFPGENGGINQSRSKAFGDRIDHTLFDIKNYYQGNNCKLLSAYNLPKTQEWLTKIGSFENLVEWYGIKGIFVNDKLDVYDLERDNGTVIKNYSKTYIWEWSDEYYNNLKKKIDEYMSKNLNMQ